MEYLNKDDYCKIRSIIEMFVGNTPRVDNLFKSLVLFLETKNKVKVIKTEKEFIPRNIEAAHRVKREIERADESIRKFSNKLLKESEFRNRKENCKTTG